MWDNPNEIILKGICDGLQSFHKMPSFSSIISYPSTDGIRIDSHFFCNTGRGLLILQNVPCGLLSDLLCVLAVIRLFENCWNGRSLYALMALHNVSLEDYKGILNSETSQLVSKINKFCILDFGKDDKSLYEVLTFVKDTCSDIFSKVVPLLDFETMKKGKLSILKDNRYNRTIEKQLDAMIDLLIGYANEKSVGELQMLKEIKIDNS